MQQHFATSCPHGDCGVRGIAQNGGQIGVLAGMVDESGLRAIRAGDASLLAAPGRGIMDPIVHNTIRDNTGETKKRKHTANVS